MDDTSDKSRQTHHYGDDMFVQLACPKCSSKFRVAWRMLPHLLRCNGCQNSFWIGKTGKIESQHKSGSRHVVCPRCNTSHEWPATAMPRHFSCRSCSFEVSTEKTADPSPQERDSASERPVHRSRRDEAASRSPALVIGVLAGLFLLGVVAVAWSIWSNMVDPQLLESANRFTVASALGQTGTAGKWVLTEHAEAYERWRNIKFRRHTPNSSDKLEITVKDYTPPNAIVTMRLERGVRERLVLDQVWFRAKDGNWKFDPQSTHDHEVAGRH